MSGVVETVGLPRLLDQAVTETRRPDHRLFVAVATALAIVSGFYALLTTFYMGSITSGLGCGALLLTLLFLPVLLLANVIGYSMLAFSATRRIFGGEASTVETLRDSLRPRVLGTVVLTGLLILFSLFFFVLPFFLTSALFSLVYQVMVVEERVGLDCIRRSSELVWRNPRGLIRTAPVLATLTIQAVFVAVSSLLTLIIQLPYQIVSQGAIWRASLGGDDGSLDGLFAFLWLQVPLTVVSTFVSTGAAYYFFHCLSLYYRDLRERNEALSLDRALSRWERARRAVSSAGRDTQSPPRSSQDLAPT